MNTLRLFILASWDIIYCMANRGSNIMLKSDWIVNICFAIAVCLAIHLRHPATLLFRREIKLQPNIDCSFMISHPLDQSNSSCVINFATIFVNQHHKTGIVLIQLGCLLLSVAFIKIINLLCAYFILLLKEDAFIKMLPLRLPYGFLEMSKDVYKNRMQHKNISNGS